jgi:hypothetical protein
VAEHRLELVAARFSELLQEVALRRGWYSADAEYNRFRRTFEFKAFAPERFIGRSRIEGGVDTPDFAEYQRRWDAGEGRTAVVHPPPRIAKQAWCWTMDLDVVGNEMDRLDPGGWLRLFGRTPDEVERRAAERLFPMVARELPSIEGWRPDDVERRLATVKAEAARRLFLLEGLLMHFPAREARRG